nr:ferritin-like domain-containing protein [uncultured Arsenicibacter sp.]
MNLQNILHEIEQVDGEVYDRLKHVTRRHMFSSITKKALSVAAPAVMATALNKAYAQSGSTVTDVLNFALTLEYLEAEFYNRGLAAGGLIPAQYRDLFDQIRKHEDAHVALLKGALGSAAVAKPNFDFTAKGTFPTVFTNFQTFSAVAQAFEDTGVRAYKGQAANLMSNDAVLTIALQIHSVEARHAARVRMLNNAKGWIVGMEGFPGAVYAGEQAAREREVNVAGLTGQTEMKISEAFDEPLTKEQVLAIATPFIA